MVQYFPLIVSEYDQEIGQLQTADKPLANVHLTLCKLETPKRVFKPTVKIQM